MHDSATKKTNYRYIQNEMKFIASAYHFADVRGALPYSSNCSKSASPITAA